MNDLKFYLYALLPVLLTIGLAGCEPGDPLPPADAEEELSGTVQIEASVSSYPFVSALADSFVQRNPKVRVEVDLSGADGGFAQLGTGGTDIVSASRAVQDQEVDRAAGNDIGFIELPVAYDALAIVTSPRNRFLTCLTTDELRKAWRPDSSLATWQSVRDSFPADPIHRYRQLVGRGTFDAFAANLLGETGAGSTFLTSENDSVFVHQALRDTSGLALVRFALYQKHRDKLRLVGIDDNSSSNGEGCVQPNVESIRSGQYEPLTRTEFIYVSMARADDPAVRAFVKYYVERAKDLADRQGYIPLTDEAYQQELERFSSRVASTVLEPTEIGRAIGNPPGEGAPAEAER